MKKLSCLAALALLAGCVDTESQSYTRYTGTSAQPYNPNTPETGFDNAAMLNNNKITGIVSRTSEQINDYIDFRLTKFTPINPDTTAPGNDEIINTAKWLLDASVEDIATKYESDTDLVQRAMYVISDRMVFCFGDSSPAKCFDEYRDGRTFTRDTNVFIKNTAELTINNAEINATDGTQIKFVIDSTSGQISDLTLSNTNGEPLQNKTYDYSAMHEFFRNGDDYVAYNSLGRQMGLTYSDFGTYNVTNETDTLVQNTPFAGGYESHEIKTTDIAATDTFNGRAIGNVTKGENRIELSDNSATLKFDKTNGTSVLSTKFTNWYDVDVTQNLTGTETKIEFSNYSGTNKNYDMKLADTPDDKGIVASTTGVNMDIHYYDYVPTNNKPSEVAGTVTFDEGISGGVQMNMAFGGK